MKSTDNSELEMSISQTDVSNIVPSVDSSLNSLENRAFQIFRDKLAKVNHYHREEIIETAKYSYFAASIFQEIIKQQYLQISEEEGL